MRGSDVVAFDKYSQNAALNFIIKSLPVYYYLQ